VEQRVFRLYRIDLKAKRNVRDYAQLCEAHVMPAGVPLAYYESLIQMVTYFLGYGRPEARPQRYACLRKAEK